MKVFSFKTMLSLMVPAVLVMLMFSRCKEEEKDITALVTVKYQNDTNVVVPFADITIGADYQDVKVVGQTDISGQFRHSFKLEAILEVIASKDTNTVMTEPPDLLVGTGVIRLKPGQTATKTIYIR